MPIESIKTFSTDGGESFRDSFRVSWDRGCPVGITGTAYMHNRTLFGENAERPGELAAFSSTAEFDAHELDDLIALLQRARREAFGDKPPMAVTMEIVERGRATDDTTGGSLVIPGDVRINGVSVLTGGGVVVHQMNIRPAKDMAAVTVTLPVRLLVIGAEGDLEGR